MLKKVYCSICLFFCLCLLVQAGLPGSSSQKRPLYPLKEDEIPNFLNSLRQPKLQKGYVFLADFSFCKNNQVPLQQKVVIYGALNENYQECWRLIIPFSDHTQQYILKVGSSIQAWSSATYASMDMSDCLKPIYFPFNYTLYDLGLLFLYWDDYKYEGPSIVKGRQAHLFLFYPPPDLAQKTNIGPIRVTIDAHFCSLLKAEWLQSDTYKVLKTMSVLNFKKTKETWLVHSIDLMDHVAKTKTRLTIREYSDHLLLDETEYFSLDSLQYIPPYQYITMEKL